MRCTGLLSFALCLLSASPILSQNMPSRFFKPGTSLETKLQSVLPKSGEEAYRTIPWHYDLGQAREEAQRTNKPLLIWMMDGHPMGST